MSNHSISHATFSVERTIDAPLERVFEAFADKTAKEKWFKGPDDDGTTQHEMDFRIGGSETNSGRFHDGTLHTFKAQYYDIIPNERIIYTYEMYLNDTRISVSLATIEFRRQGDATLLSLNEDGAYLDGLDKMESRMQGTQELLSALNKSVKEN